MGRAVGPSPIVFGCNPGALPQAGIAAGLWPFRKSTHSTGKGQRLDPIPDRGIAPGQDVHRAKRAESPPYPAVHIKLKMQRDQNAEGPKCRGTNAEGQNAEGQNAEGQNAEGQNVEGQNAEGQAPVRFVDCPAGER